MEEEEEEGQTIELNSQRKQKTVITIPSYQQVLRTSQSKSNPPSLFTPSQSFSQAFSFLKHSEFYSPPPPPSNASSSSSSSSFSSLQASVITAPIQSDQAAEASSSSSAAPATPLLSASSSNHSRNAILVSNRQKGNPLLKHIRNVRWTFADVLPDYVLGQSSCALYLSIRYHLLHPEYLYYRIRELQKTFKLRVVLCHVDVEDVVKPLLEVTKTALLHDCTLLCGWSLEECGRYLETIKVYENKPADIIQGQMDTDYISRMSHALTTVRHVNKTDVVTLGTTFGSLSHIMDASMEDLARCPGMGERKVKRLYDTFHEPFKRVVPSLPPFSEVPVQDNSELHTVREEGEGDDADDALRERKKGPDLTVKSALSAAFSKYGDKVNKRKKSSRETKKKETSVSMALEAHK